MHEMSLAESVREIIEDAAREQGFSRVRTVWLEIGQLSCVEPEAMRFCFDAAMEGSIGKGARLEIIEIPGSGRCEACGETVEMQEQYGLCSKCGSPRIQIINGDQMRVKDLEVD